jgi:hypothetical protein
VAQSEFTDTLTVKEMIMKIPLIQIDDEIREMDDDELVDYKQRQLIEAENVAAKITKAAAKAAIADRLGLTSDELATLLS